MKKQIAALAIIIGALGSFGAIAQQNNVAPAVNATKGEMQTVTVDPSAAPEKCNDKAECIKGKKHCKNADMQKCKKGKKGNNKFGKMGKKGGKKGCMNPALRGLNLTDAQKATLKEQCKVINEKYAAEFKKLKESKNNDMEKELKKILTSDQWKQYETQKAEMQKMAKEYKPDWTQKREK